jgi:ABC-2 type transport system permease protein
MFAIFRKELHAFFNSLIAYVIIGFFLILTGLWVWVFPETNVLDGGYADLSSLFRLAPYVLMFLAPAITMGLLSEELKMGTLELLLTSPLTTIQIILGKYLASLVIIASILLFTSIYAISIYYLASPMGNIDIAGLIGSYIGLMLLSAVFLGIGLVASSFTQSQIVAFLIGTFFCFLLYQGFDAWTTLKTWEKYSLFISQLGILYHYESLSRGVIDLRDVLYFCSFSMLSILITNLALSRR